MTIQPRGIPVAWGESPFAAYDGRVYREVMPEGLSIAEIVQRCPTLPVNFAEAGTVLVNGDPVPRALWARVRPKSNGPVPVSVTMHLPLGQGGTGGGSAGGKSALALVAAIVVLVAASYVSGGALAPILGSAFAAGTIGAHIAGAAVSLIGVLAVHALSPPPALPQGGNGNTPGQPGSASASGNVIAPGGTLPRVCGSMKIFPSLAVEPLIDIQNQNEIVTGIYALAGPHRWTDIRVNGAPIDGDTGLTYETREGWESDLPLTLQTRQSRTMAPQIQMTDFLFGDANVAEGGWWQIKDQGQYFAGDAGQDNLPNTASDPQWHSMSTRQSPDEFWIQLYFPAGINDAANVGQDQGVPFRLQVRRRGTGTWIDLPEIHLASHKVQLYRTQIKLIWGTLASILGTVPTPPMGSTSGWWLAEIQKPSFTDSGGVVDAVWNADPSFRTSTSTPRYLDNSTVGTTKVKNVALYQDHAEIYLDPGTFPKGIYDVRVKKGAAYLQGSFNQSTYSYGGGTGVPFFNSFILNPGGGLKYYAIRNDATIQQSAYIPRIVNIWNQPPVGRRGMALIAVQATNRAIQAISAVAGGYVRDWDGSGWSTWTVTSNPAPHYRDVLTGDLTRRPVNKVDDASIVAWRANCIAKGYTFDGILDGRSMSDAQNLLASMGRGRPLKSESWGVAMDRDRSADSPVQIFSPRNLANFRWEMPFPYLPDGFLVNFLDSLSDYIPQQAVVYRAGFDSSTATNLESVDYIGPVTNAAAVARATYDLKQPTLRSALYFGDADVESIVCRKGDLVGVQYDVINLQAGFARIKTITLDGSGNVTGLVLDSTIPDLVAANLWQSAASIWTPANFWAPNTQTGVAIRLLDGSLVTKQIVAGSGESDTITFTTPFADLGPRLGATCLVISGALGQEFKRLIVSNIAAGADLTATLSFVDEAPGLWS